MDHFRVILVNKLDIGMAILVSAVVAWGVYLAMPAVVLVVLKIRIQVEVALLLRLRMCLRS
jgi:hypothetical protein